jgi:release factor glutamine methyltransferase
MTIDHWVMKSEAKLIRASIATARLDTLVLLEDALGKDRSWLLAHPEHQLTTTTLANLDEQIARRSKQEPLAYIRGKTEFYGREFEVTPHTLEPRPETEDMIDLLKSIWQNDFKDWRVADVGTGSGAIGLTAALELGITNLELTDIDRSAMAVARRNAKKHGIEPKFTLCNLLANCLLPIHIILANLPYVPDSHTINQAAMQEPRHAIFGGEDGLDLYRRLFDQITKRQHPPQYIFTESLPFQHDDLAKIADKADYKPLNQEGFVQVFEFIPARLKSL